MKKFLQTVPLFLLLLPVFFLVHLLTDYFRLITFGQLFIRETFWYLLVSIVLFILLIRKRRLALLAFVLLFVFFFFGPMHLFLKENLRFLSQYSVLLPLLGIIFFTMAVFILRSRKPFYKAYQYLNILLLVFLGYEIVLISLLNITDGKVRNFRKDFPIAENFKDCDTCMNPDIYYLVFDMYANSGVLKSYWNYDNHKLEKFLDSSGFYHISNSTSNYNFTVFSIASSFQMDYTRKNRKYTNAFSSSAELSQVEDNELFRILKKQGYSFYNYSWFHFHDAPSLVAPFTLTEPRELVAAQTLWYRLKSDILWRFKSFENKNELISPFLRNELINNLRRVRQCYDGIKTTSAKNNNAPVFLYAHFPIPHGPFQFDSTGNVRDTLTWLSRNPADFLQQVKYTNNIITDLCTTLQKEAKRPRIIIVQSDHGYRPYSQEEMLSEDVQFKNFTALYFPGKEYAGLHDSLSNVNTFRIVLDKYFNYKLPLLKDTSFYMMLR
jgi:hypothetical protein